MKMKSQLGRVLCNCQLEIQSNVNIKFLFYTNFVSIVVFEISTTTFDDLYKFVPM